jgi:hypothetical protein
MRGAFDLRPQSGGFQPFIKSKIIHLSKKQSADIPEPKTNSSETIEELKYDKEDRQDHSRQPQRVPQPSQTQCSCKLHAKNAE